MSGLVSLRKKKLHDSGFNGQNRDELRQVVWLVVTRNTLALDPDYAADMSAWEYAQKNSAIVLGNCQAVFSNFLPVC